mmetsp:Transcript_32023/g.90876  ORF Transcript_32023/g.90876 Transcript_32023/m.90876 type:complete len:126 (+) Transcript_32023:580-957(+)
MDGMQPPGHPVATRQFQEQVEGFSTDFLISVYDDQLQIMATQLDTFGTVLQAREERALEGDPTYSVTVLLGRRDEPVLSLCARGLVERISAQGCAKPLLLFLGFKEHSASAARRVIDVVMSNRIW